MAEKGWLIGAVVGTVIAVGGGFAFGMLGIKTEASPPPMTDPAAGAAATSTAKAKAPPLRVGEVKPLPPIVINLREPANLYVRLEAAVVMEPNTAESAEIAAKIGDDLVSYLRTVSISELQSPTGFQYFREDLKRRAVQLGGGKVRELLLQSFVIE
jgi:flagellar FliL protein